VERQATNAPLSTGEAKETIAILRKLFILERSGFLSRVSNFFSPSKRDQFHGDWSLNLTIDLLSNFKPRTMYPHERAPCPMNRKLDGSQIRAGGFGEEKISLAP
jgi:hypothetical protein